MVSYPISRSAYGSLLVIRIGNTESYTVKFAGFCLLVASFEW